MSDPRIPAALAPVVAGVVSLHDFRPQAMHKMHKRRAQFTLPDQFGGTAYAVVPADLAKIYNLSPLFGVGVSGQGQTIVLIEDTDVFSSTDWTTFRSTFGLSGYTSASFAQVHPAPPSGPNNCGAPVPLLLTTRKPSSTPNGPARPPQAPLSKWRPARIPAPPSAA